MNNNSEKPLKVLSAYGRSYVRYLLDGIDREKCYEGVTRFLEAIEDELEKRGTLTEADVFKLRQIYFRTNNDTAPRKPEYHLFLVMVVDTDMQ